MSINDMIVEFMDLFGDDTKCLKYIDEHINFYDVKIQMRGWTATPFLYACNYGYEEVAIAMIYKGADIYNTCSFGYTPLILACSNGQSQLVKELIVRGVELNTRNDNHTKTALIAACDEYNIKCNIDIVQLLVKNGVDFAYMGNPEIRCDTKYLEIFRRRYIHLILSVINDEHDDNAMAQCFKTTYVPQIISLISEFIL
ncbi:MAG: hypothetical protein Faunusvirus20_4 [Faunusvirus sp.]|uniref:Uncharacterized protein n=1 Tax=Faunusvirus sp. TaxID=2487766 RepID=A0A3G4ZZT0_9VIRU|nr:MAG: hypothetical protein Faunusvirus20_4 [Faunusvirus sp.]